MEKSWRRQGGSSVRERGVFSDFSGRRGHTVEDAFFEARELLRMEELFGNDDALAIEGNKKTGWSYFCRLS